mmetsp:Transcript_43843/g.121292  ORF Transcript_43843/g.121292 Transcript_43843/m.121292 type:complete len:275 (+) Transcript_43843:1382-2206(+)
MAAARSVAAAETPAITIAAPPLAVQFKACSVTRSSEGPPKIVKKRGTDSRMVLNTAAFNVCGTTMRCVMLGFASQSDGRRGATPFCGRGAASIPAHAGYTIVLMAFSCPKARRCSCPRTGLSDMNGLCPPPRIRDNSSPSLTTPTRTLSPTCDGLFLFKLRAPAPRIAPVSKPPLRTGMLLTSQPHPSFAKTQRLSANDSARTRSESAPSTKSKEPPAVPPVDAHTVNWGATMPRPSTGSSILLRISTGSVSRGGTNKTLQVTPVSSNTKWLCV